MATAADMLVHEELGAEGNSATRPEWVREPIIVRTYLTHDELAARDLRIVDVANVVEFAAARHGMFGAQTLKWLERRPVDDLTSPSTKQSWRRVLDDRIDELRALAVDEEQPFDEESAAAALRFIDMLDGGRRPGAFLVGGNVRLVWRALDGEQVGLQFRGPDKVQFVYLELDGEGLGHTMGTGSHDMIHRALKAPGLSRILNG